MLPPPPMSDFQQGAKTNTKNKKKKKSKRLLSAPPQREDLFATIRPRPKFDVLGKKRKGEEQRIGLPRSTAIQKEYEQRRKSSVYKDKRIGEQDDSLQDRDKAILRRIKEHSSKSKRKRNADSLNSNAKIRSMAFNQAEGTEKPYKTKKQVMSEIIEESKFYKAEKAKEKEEDEQLIGKLDQDFNSLAQTEALNALLTKHKTGQTRNEKSTKSKPDFSLTKEKPDAYDKLVKEMVMELRARPSDRVKPPEEIAREERERLERLEEERQKRMLAPDDDADSSEEDDDYDDEKMSEKLRSTSGDSFLLDDDSTVKNNESSEEENDDSTVKTNDSPEEEEYDDSTVTNNDSEEEENDDSEEYGEEDESDYDEDEKEEELEKKMKDWDLINEKKEDKKEAKSKNVESKEGLPFVIEAPHNFKELCELLDDRSESEIIEAIQRIRACNSAELCKDNRKKMQVFYGLLLQYFATVSARTPSKTNILVKPLIEMSAETPYFAAICACVRLRRIRNKLCQDLIRTESHACAEPSLNDQNQVVKGKEPTCWPGVKTLALFGLWWLVFPSSDSRHPVTTPLLAMTAEFLARCPVRGGRDLAVGSFLCSMILSVVKQSRKYCGEAITFIKAILLSSINLDQEIQIPSQLAELPELREIKPYLFIKKKECEIEKINLISLFENQHDSPYFSSDEFKASVLLSASEVLMGFVQVYADLNSFPEIFNSISVLLLAILERNELPDLLRTNLQNCEYFIERKITEHNNMRVPLQMHKKEFEQIKLMNPEFEENFARGVDYDPDRERVTQKKLVKKIKSEEKGWRRKLRVVKYFLVEVREAMRREEEAKRAEERRNNLELL
ncbi:hypothetical protein LUZ60_003415 [Juncus effusus]|nr:hypothetical protein LUZ60_003415 [Juncus effusus]